MARVNTYLNFSRNTEEAFNFYKSVFGGEFVGGRNRIVPEPLLPSRDLRAAWVETQDRGGDRIEALRLAGGIRVRPPAVAESMIAAAGVEQSVIGIARLRARVEFNRSHRVG